MSVTNVHIELKAIKQVPLGLLLQMIIIVINLGFYIKSTRMY